MEKLKRLTRPDPPDPRLDARFARLEESLRSGAITDADETWVRQAREVGRARHELARARLREQEAALREGILVPAAPIRDALLGAAGRLRAALEDIARRFPGSHAHISRAFDALAKDIDKGLAGADAAAKAIVAKTPDAATGRAKRSRNAAPKAKATRKA